MLTRRSILGRCALLGWCVGRAVMAQSAGAQAVLPSAVPGAAPANAVLGATMAAAKAGDADAQYRLGWLYETGAGGVPTNMPEALTWYRQSAEAGSIPAQERLGALCDGLDPKEDLRAAIERHIFWNRKAAEKGGIGGIGHMIEAYEKGEGGVVPKDPAQVAFWYQRLLEQWELRAAKGDSTAMCHVAYQHLLGLGVETNATRAAEWFGKAAGAGEREAMTNLGDLRRTGNGVEKDVAVAVSLYTQAADAGDPRAMWRLAESQAAGSEQAEALYKKALGILSADVRKRCIGVVATADLHWILCRMYAEGKGTPADPTAARAWCEQAARYGHPEAKEVLRKARATP